ncbi:MAG: LytTR family DNA-binding domain-containing protein [Verrucomicrobiota bacterium]|nr:LytTR family DNA-binding domain-containing protein [Verrucomicrobiota bacterium]
MKIRTLIIDDEELARDRIRSLLSNESSIEIIGECSDGKTAVEMIDRESPDLVFLDVQMPELDGFQVLESISPEKTPKIIFVTAHEKFALRAFDFHAIDYLLKPFDRDRFKLGLDRAVSQLQSKDHDSTLARQMSALLSDLQKSKPMVERLVVKSDGRVLLIKVEDLDWVEAADNYVNLHVGTESHLLRETMSSLEKRLPEETFMRISRSTIVNVERIKELQPLFHGEYVVLLKNGARLTLSRSYRDKLNTLLGRAD